MAAKPATTSTRLAHGNKGRGLELVIVASQRDVVRLDRTPQAAEWRWNKQTGLVELRPVKGPVDYVGTVLGTGRVICLDAKSCKLATRFPVGHEDHFPRHQREYLVRHGRAGAVAGLLVEATHPKVAAYFWLGWPGLVADRPSVEWGDPALVRLGPTSKSIDFRMIPELRTP